MLLTCCRKMNNQEIKETFVVTCFNNSERSISLHAHEYLILSVIAFIWNMWTKSHYDWVPLRAFQTTERLVCGYVLHGYVNLGTFNSTFTCKSMHTMQFLAIYCWRSVFCSLANVLFLLHQNIFLNRHKM